jgi:hypothetical protein
MRHILSTLLVGSALFGCGGGGVTLPNSLQGSFSMAEGAIMDIVSTVNDPKYKGSRSRDLGSDSDRVGWSLAIFKKEAAGTPLEADADEIAKRLIELEQLLAKRAPVAKQREAAKRLQEKVAELKAKM